MKNRRTIKWLSALTAALLLSACSASSMYVDKGFKIEEGKTVAVLTFQNLSTLPKAGDIVAGLFSSELMRAAGVAVAEPSVVTKQLADAGTALDETVAPADLQAIGRQLGTFYILAGTVNEFRYRHNINEQPVVSVTARILDVRSGLTVWSATRSETGPSVFPGQQSLGMLAQNVVRAMVKTFKP